MRTEWVVTGALAVLLLLFLIRRRRAVIRAQKYLDESKSRVALSLGRILDTGNRPALDTRNSRAKLTVLKG